MKSHFSIPFYLCLIVIFSSCTGNVYNYDDAVRSMKVLNSDMVNFFTAVSGNQEFEALSFLWKNPSSPVPYKKEEFSVGKPFQDFDFNSQKGIYHWDKGTEAFHKQASAEVIEINLPASKSDSLFSFIISSFDQTEISSRPKFPTNVSATLFLNSDEKLIVSHKGWVEDDLPKEFHTVLEGDGFLWTATFDRTRNNNSGAINFKLDIKRAGISFITFDMDAEIGYGLHGYYFNEIEFESNLFNHRINGKIHYGNINPTSEQYVESWNENTKIELFEMPLKRKVGDIILGTTDNGVLQDYFIRFSNGKIELVSYYLKFMDKILNFKY